MPVWKQFVVTLPSYAVFTLEKLTWKECISKTLSWQNCSKLLRPAQQRASASSYSAWVCAL